MLQVYGPTIKELIHEQCGDGIMSAINFRLDVKRVPDPAGDRVVGPLAHGTDLDPNLLNGRKSSSPKLSAQPTLIMPNPSR